MRPEPAPDLSRAAQDLCPRIRFAERCSLSLEDQCTVCELGVVSRPAILHGDCGTDSLSAERGQNKAGTRVRAERWNITQP